MNWNHFDCDLLELVFNFTVYVMSRQITFVINNKNKLNLSSLTGFYSIFIHLAAAFILQVYSYLDLQKFEFYREKFQISNLFQI